ncbi:hypothetical protein [Halovivax cerinus]|uniref:NMD protein affecting ribosome stability and mRNA decay n=1 Tax=Halovivax cerinus TaxID=1487865 RepID=A0ABD5NJ53_9EURY|nr:hypothetical protein [Halovivax cerinus]
MTESVDPSAGGDRRCLNCETVLPPETSHEDATWDLGTRGIDAETVIVCPDCAALLRGGVPEWRTHLDEDRTAGILDFLRAVTKTQGRAVADVASLSTETTGGIDSAGERRTYHDRRQASALRLAIVDRHLVAAGVDAAALEPTDPSAHVAPVTVDTHVLSDETGVDATVVATFETVLSKGVELQRLLRTALVLAETAVAVDGACQVCLEPVTSEAACPACGTRIQAVSAWHDETGSPDVVSLYGTITDRLETASATTSHLTESAGSLADLLVE